MGGNGGIVSVQSQRLGGLGAAILSFVAGGAGAQSTQPVAIITSPPAIQPVSEDKCVLHVWPAGDARSSYTGWFHGGAVDGDKRGIKGYPDMHGSTLNVAAQHDLLTKFDWTSRRRQPGLTVVVHDAPPPPSDDIGRTSALIADHPSCYDELLVHSVFVEGATFSSTSVRLMMVAKRWRGPSPPATYTAMSVEKIDLKATEPGAIEASLRSGFVSAIDRYLQDEHFLHRN